MRFRGGGGVSFSGLRGFGVQRRSCCRPTEDRRFRLHKRPKCANRLFCFAKCRVTPFTKREMQPPRNASDRAVNRQRRGAAETAAWPVSILKWGAITLALGVMFAWFGVYDTGFVPLPERIVYWTGTDGGRGHRLDRGGPLVFEKLDARGAPRHPDRGGRALIISVPITIGLVVLEALDGTVAPPDWWALQYVYVIVISALLTAGAWADRPCDGETEDRDSAPRYCRKRDGLQRPPAGEVPRRHGLRCLGRGSLSPRPHQRG